MPLLRSVVAETVPVLAPPVFVKTTVWPPAIREFPLASFAVKVRVTAEPDATELAERETRDCESEGEPGVTVTLGALLVTGPPPIVAPIEVALPEVTPVKVAV